MDTNTPFSKYDHFPEPQDPYKKSQLESARTACRLLRKVSVLSRRTQANLCLSIISLCRRARLTTEERDSIFGQGFLEQQLFERVLDSDQEAIALVILEAIDDKRYEAAAKLAGDITDLDEIVEGKLDEFLENHSPDAALLCLLSNRLGNLPFWHFDLKDMMAVAERNYPNITEFFEML